MADHPTTRRQSSGGNGGDGGGMRTVDCLRGRLLAERVTSKAAKEEADQLAQKLEELEKKLSDEVKMMSKAERRLQRAVKKLESLKALGAGSLSSNGCAGHQAPEVVGEMNSPPAASLSSTVGSGPLGDGESAPGSSSAGSCAQVNSSQDGSWFSVVSEQSGVREEENEAMDSDEGGGGARDHDSSERERAQEQPVASNCSSDTDDRDEDADRLALVLVDDPHHGADAGGPKTEDDVDARTYRDEEDECRLAIVMAYPEKTTPRLRDAEKRDVGGSTDVESVLLALRQVKEQLRYTIERRSPGLVALCGH